jgi:hypothetical protein
MSEYLSTKYDRYDKDDKLKNMMLKLTDYKNIDYQRFPNGLNEINNNGKARVKDVLQFIINFVSLSVKLIYVIRNNHFH